MWPSQQENILRVLQLQGQQQNDGFQTLDASIDIISQKDVIRWLDISIWQLITWRPKGVK